MDDYNHQLGKHSNSRGSSSNGNFLYWPGGPVLGPSSSSGYSSYGRTSRGGGFHLHQPSGGGDCYDHNQGPIVKTKSGSTWQNNNHCGPNPKFNHHNRPPVIKGHFEGDDDVRDDEVDAIKAKIIAHPQYSNLLKAYMDCQKVGAPPEVVARMAEVRQEFETRQRAEAGGDDSKDPELDQFMEAYYDMLVKYREELMTPLQEAMDFMRRIQTQLNMLSNNAPPLRIFNSEDKFEVVGRWEEEQDKMSGCETGVTEIDPRTDDGELKKHLLKKYSGGYLSSLKQELSKKKKKGKLPKDARHKLLNWWELHYNWPYPSDSEKVTLAESTGLDQKQINNWFINQRKRHWKPSKDMHEDMHFMVMEGLHPQTAALYMEGH